jgi:hypothetical protein
MTITTGEHTIDRARLINWAKLSGQLQRYVNTSLISNLEKLGEHSVDIDGLARFMRYIPGVLFDDVLDKDFVHHNNIKIILNKKRIEIE